LQQKPSKLVSVGGVIALITIILVGIVYLKTTLETEDDNCVKLDGKLIMLAFVFCILKLVAPVKFMLLIKFCVTVFELVEPTLVIWELAVINLSTCTVVVGYAPLNPLVILNGIDINVILDVEKNGDTLVVALGIITYSKTE